MEKRPDDEPTRRPDPDRFVAPVPGTLGPRRQIALALAMMAPLAILWSGPHLIFRIVPQLGPSIGSILNASFVWLVLLSLLLLSNGLIGLLGTRRGRKPPPVIRGSGEKELLGALSEHGELTSAQAAMETSLSVNEADEMLKGLTEKGHIQVRVRGGGLFYSLWEVEGGAETGQIEGR